MTNRSPWWMPHVHADRRPYLLVRNRIQASIRSYFAAVDFIEVDPPSLQVSPGNETHLHAFATRCIAPAGASVPLYLHTSPEFSCKKLLSAGERRIVFFGHVFRNRERGRLHAPEFTMLEWYRAREPHHVLMRDCTALLRIAAETTQRKQWEFRGLRADPHAEPESLTVADAFRRFAGLDLLATGDDVRALAAAAAAVGIRTAPDDTWSDVFSRILSERVEPHLGIDRPLFLTEYPISEAALARPATDPRVAERFELYVCGVELANAFGELTDPVEQRRRFTADMDAKQAIYGERYPLDEDFLAALAHMPPACGAALGLDRLVMLATGAARVEQVMWAPTFADDE